MFEFLSIRGLFLSTFIHIEEGSDTALVRSIFSLKLGFKGSGIPALAEADTMLIDRLGCSGGESLAVGEREGPERRRSRSRQRAFISSYSTASLIEG